MPAIHRISPCLWFDRQAEEAARFYTSVFPNSRITAILRYGEAGKEIHGRPAGSVMTVAFELDGTPFTALNGGPVFRFTEAVSFEVSCEDQGEVDRYWDALGAGGVHQHCGWLSDRYGLSWQVVPRELADLLDDPDPRKVERVMEALLAMKKLDLAALREAYAG
ncbi:MAG TPA: VOC family protein [Woeseiaceae bacterium]|nr:VOC family protein [Woeseiaceae bacterium]